MMDVVAEEASLIVLLHHSHLVFLCTDILVSTPNRLIFLLQQDPPAVDLSR